MWRLCQLFEMGIQNQSTCQIVGKWQQKNVIQFFYSDNFSVLADSGRPHRRSGNNRREKKVVCWTTTLCTVIVVSCRLTECCFGQNVHSSSGSHSHSQNYWTAAVTTAKHAYNLFVAAVCGLHLNCPMSLRAVVAAPSDWRYPHWKTPRTFPWQVEMNMNETMCRIVNGGKKSPLWRRSNRMDTQRTNGQRHFALTIRDEKYATHKFSLRMEKTDGWTRGMKEKITWKLQEATFARTYAKCSRMADRRSPVSARVAITRHYMINNNKRRTTKCCEQHSKAQNAHIFLFFSWAYYSAFGSAEPYFRLFRFCRAHLTTRAVTHFFFRSLMCGCCSCYCHCLRLLYSFRNLCAFFCYASDSIYPQILLF